MSARARVLEYGVTLDERWAATSDRGGSTLPHEDGLWTPEHLVLAGLARCTLTSLRHHCRRAGIALTASASARGTVTKRPQDGRYAFVAIDVVLDVSLDPSPGPEDAADLIAKAERDCFVGASLTAAPRYAWTVDGRVA